MALVDVTRSCLDSIRQISEELEGAIVYIDDGFTESFQFMGAFPLLLELGAWAVCSLENMTSLDVVVDCNSAFDSARKLVIMTSCLLSDVHRYILRCLGTHQRISCCIIFTSVSEGAHSTYPDSPLGPDAFHEYESLLLQDYEELIRKYKSRSEDEGWSQLSFNESYSADMGPLGEKSLHEDDPLGILDGLRQKLTISMHHFPLVLCPISPRVFVLPSKGLVAEACLSGQNADSLSSGLPPLSTGLTSDTDDIPPGATLTAHFLYHLATKLDLKLEIFSLGDLSRNIGNIMTDMSSLYDVGRRKRPAGLLLVDRTLDLLTPCCHGDSLIDCIFSSLPRRERTSLYSTIRGQEQLKQRTSLVHRASLDVQVPLSDILMDEDENINGFEFREGIEAFLRGWESYTTGTEVIDSISVEKPCNEKPLPIWTELLNGSLVSTESFRGTPYMAAILDRRVKDGAVLLKKWLQEALHRENMVTDIKSRPGFATKLELLAMVKALAKTQSSLIRNKGIIQLAAATAIALDGTKSARWEAFSSAEKMLRVSAGDTSQSLAAQIDDLIHKSALVEMRRGMNEKPDTSVQGLLSFQDALLLTIVGYILAGENFPTSGSGGPFSWQEEHFLKEAILDAILENPPSTTLKFLQGLTEELETRLHRIHSEETKESSSDQLEIDDLDDPWEKWGDDEDDEERVNSNSKDQSYDDVQLKLELRDRVDCFFRFLHKLSSLRRKNLPLKGVLPSADLSGDPLGGKGLLYRLLAKVLSRHDIPGLEYHSSTVGRLLKSGFGRFGLGQAKPSLADQSIILVFVAGGINGHEALEVQEALMDIGRPDVEVILGGTTLLTPHDMLDLLLGNSSHL